MVDELPRATRPLVASKMALSPSPLSRQRRPAHLAPWSEAAPESMFHCFPLVPVALSERYGPRFALEPVRISPGFPPELVHVPHRVPLPMARFSGSVLVSVEAVVIPSLIAEFPSEVALANLGINPVVPLPVTVPE